VRERDETRVTGPGSRTRYVTDSELKVALDRQEKQMFPVDLFAPKTVPRAKGPFRTPGSGNKTLQLVPEPAQWLITGDSLTEVLERAKCILDGQTQGAGLVYPPEEEELGQCYARHGQQCVEFRPFTFPTRNQLAGHYEQFRDFDAA
jgi:hypothetical protein